jgi:hypothetical protein
MNIAPQPVRVDVKVGQPLGHVALSRALEFHSFTSRRRTASRHILHPNAHCPLQPPMGIPPEAARLPRLADIIYSPA